MRRAGATLAALALLILPVAAEVAPDNSLRPQARPDTQNRIEAPRAGENTAELAAAIAVARKRPLERPPSEQELAAADRPDGLPFAFPDTSRRPFMRPDSVVVEAMAKRRLKRKGAVCGNIEIQGVEVGRVPGSGVCGIKDAVRVRSVSGVALSQESLISCDTAKALNKWVDKTVQPAFSRQGPVVQLQVAAHYACRTRNNQKGAKISEHGKGNAIDIAGFVMQSGEVVTVLGDYTGKGPLSKIRRGACGTFGTVLGPGSDGYHRNHFHLDVAHHRGGAYCR